MRRLKNTSAKRALDLCVSGLGVILAAPIAAVVAVLIMREDRGPVLFRQQRAGQDGQVFTMYKFRSMRTAAADARPIDTSEWTCGVPDDFVFKAAAANDDRLTRVGRVLRRTSLDELPQLVNVIRGDMSVVGPRPEILPIANCYNATQRRRLAVKPGVTGWAQVNGRADSNHGAKIDADLFYVEHTSLRLDLTILARTILISVSGKGAF